MHTSASGICGSVRSNPQASSRSRKRARAILTPTWARRAATRARPRLGPPHATPRQLRHGGAPSNGHAGSGRALPRHLDVPRSLPPATPGGAQHDDVHERARLLRALRRLERHRDLRLDLHLHLPRSPQARHRVLMNCVDTGWVTDNAPGGAGPVAKTHATCDLARSRAISPHVSVFVARTHATRAEAEPATPRRPRARFPTRLGCRPTHTP